MEKISIVQQSSLGLVWFGGWLFTLGLLKLGFFKARAFPDYIELFERFFAFAGEAHFAPLSD